MPTIIWTQEYEIGIDVIDQQHRRIVDYINKLFSLESEPSKEEVNHIMLELVDYTCSHFAFEEELLEESNYDATDIHKETHKAFTDEIHRLKQRLKDGEDIVQETADLLKSWLLQHIMHDDQSYSRHVKENILKQTTDVHQSWITRASKKYFQL